MFVGHEDGCVGGVVLIPLHEEPEEELETDKEL